MPFQYRTCTGRPIHTLNAVLYELIYASIELFWGMIAESEAANLALNIAQVLLFRFMSFHALSYASIELLLGMVAESTAANLALATLYGFLFRSLSFGVKVMVWCLDLSLAIIELLPRVLSE